ncbi:MAG: Mrp/NBP35 family ATP-binding protein [Methanotrichaceae archaeon]
MSECDDKCETCAEKGTCTDPKKEMEKQIKLASKKMSKIKYKIIVASGKGGVGKSTVTVNLARALQARGYKVGILDADITGPNIAKLLNVEDAQLVAGPNGVEAIDAKGLKVISMAFALPSKDSAVIWRGPMKMIAIRQFMTDINWGDDLDFFIIDLPPGTSDEPLSVVQLIPDLSGAVIVTTPQEVALLDSRKAVNMVKSMNVPLLGIVENMSGLRCPHCGEVVNIFKTGGGKKAAEELEIPFLGAIPLDPEISSLGDSGITFVEQGTVATKSFQEIVDCLLQKLGESKEK